MQTIQKHAITLSGEFRLLLPAYHDVIHVAFQNGVPCIWVQVDTTHTEEYTTFYVFKDTEDMSAKGDPDECWHVGTFTSGMDTWHLYELTSAPEED